MWSALDGEWSRGMPGGVQVVGVDAEAAAQQGGVQLLMQCYRRGSLAMTGRSCDDSLYILL